MNKTIYEAEFTKMVHDKMREANRFKEYERIPKNRIGEYSCAVTPQVRQTGNRLSGLAGTAYASLLT